MGQIRIKHFNLNFHLRYCSHPACPQTANKCDRYLHPNSEKRECEPWDWVQPRGDHENGNRGNGDHGNWGYGNRSYGNWLFCGSVGGKGRVGTVARMGMLQDPPAGLELGFRWGFCHGVCAAMLRVTLAWRISKKSYL